MLVYPHGYTHIHWCFNARKGLSLRSVLAYARSRSGDDLPQPSADGSVVKRVCCFASEARLQPRGKCCKRGKAEGIVRRSKWENFTRLHLSLYLGVVEAVGSSPVTQTSKKPRKSLIFSVFLCFSAFFKIDSLLDSAVKIGFDHMFDHLGHRKRR